MELINIQKYIKERIVTIEGELKGLRSLLISIKKTNSGKAPSPELIMEVDTIIKEIHSRIILINELKDLLDEIFS